MPAWWVTPRHLAGDDGALADHVASHLTGAGWIGLTLVRGRREPDEPEEARQVVRSTVLYVAPDGLRWAQWVLADEPILLGDVPVAWTASARASEAGLAEWTAYFSTGVPPEAVADFLLALECRPDPAYGFAGPNMVFDALAEHGWVRDIDNRAVVSDPRLTAGMALNVLPVDGIQDGDPLALDPVVDPTGWQAWCEPRIGGGFLWAAVFSASTPHDLVAAFAGSLASADPVLRHTLPQGSEGQLLVRPTV
ncbi:MULTISPECIES: DUF317 domain-containing protein [Streptomyces]|uniref:DUF317 domain-containing protein n=1 Tax=Streptomyces changanensis TaxID=2964669 RepID=A0ABY5ND50_9ACTN|nr:MULTISPECIES: DUF317 domain-containing protein [Streptomyces]UUS33982.1 DUF317 domain-containing protein [Streptomyces changanensis]